MKKKICYFTLFCLRHSDVHYNLSTSLSTECSRLLQDLLNLLCNFISKERDVCTTSQGGVIACIDGRILGVLKREDARALFVYPTIFLYISLHFSVSHHVAVPLVNDDKPGLCINGWLVCDGVTGGGGGARGRAIVAAHKGASAFALSYLRSLKSRTCMGCSKALSLSRVDLIGRGYRISSLSRPLYVTQKKQFALADSTMLGNVLSVRGILTT